MNDFTKKLVAFTILKGTTGTTDNWKLTVVAWLALELKRKTR